MTNANTHNNEWQCQQQRMPMPTTMNTNTGECQQQHHPPVVSRFFKDIPVNLSKKIVEYSWWIHGKNYGQIQLLLEDGACLHHHTPVLTAPFITIPWCLHPLSTLYDAHSNLFWSPPIHLSGSLLHILLPRPLACYTTTDCPHPRRCFPSCFVVVPCPFLIVPRCLFVIFMCPHSPPFYHYFHLVHEYIIKNENICIEGWYNVYKMIADAAHQKKSMQYSISYPCCQPKGLKLSRESCKTLWWWEWLVSGAACTWSSPTLLRSAEALCGNASIVFCFSAHILVVAGSWW